jgi:MinD-like ATPase involved in chromosome partitioning or flagellar assembly
MTIVAVAGEGSTTIAAGLASVWPSGDRVVLAEFDPSGGCLSAWLGVPRSPGLADVVAGAGADTWPRIEASLQPTPAGLELLAAPHRAVEAAAVINAATTTVLPVLAALADVVAIADCGRMRNGLAPAVSLATAVVVAHRQHPGSAAAATVGLERVADIAEQLRRRGTPHVVALIGSRPYSTGDVAAFLGSHAVLGIADDPWAAALLAGRSGSTIRLRRSPLFRSLATLAGATNVHVRHPVAH